MPRLEQIWCDQQVQKNAAEFAAMQDADSDDDGQRHARVRRKKIGLSEGRCIHHGGSPKGAGRGHHRNRRKWT